MTSFRRDRTRTVTLWTKDRSTMVEIPEDDWPRSTHGDDYQAAQAWAELSGLTVTIRTEVLTTAEVQDAT